MEARKSGNFVTFNFERSVRFLDSPEFTVLHDRGTSEVFLTLWTTADRDRYVFHVNLFLAAEWLSNTESVRSAAAARISANWFAR